MYITKDFLGTILHDCSNKFLHFILKDSNDDDDEKDVYQRFFRCSNMAKDETRPMVPFLARLAHGYPQGRF